jgi:glucose-1-phosphate thymidylyltransferase
MLDRAVLLAGGKGTRLLESTKIHNKHLLPVYSSQGATPMIFFPLNTLIRSGAKKILIVSSQEHCGNLIELLGDGKRFGSDIDFTYKIQDHHDESRPVGIASALALAKDFVGKEKFSVILGDNFYENEFSYDFINFEKGNSDSHIFLKSVHDIKRFGCAEVDSSGKVLNIVEKPEFPKSSLAVSGLYLFTPDVFEVAKMFKPSSRNEMEIADILDFYTKKGTITYTVIKNFWHDLGTSQSMRDATDYINKIGFKHIF